MNILYKLLFMLSFTISLNALDFNQTQICQAFEDGIQTRTNNSKIKFINHSYLFNNLDNTLNGTKVINNNSNLSCRDVNNTTDENCQSSNILGYSLGTITRQSPQTFTLGLPVTTSTQKIKFKQNGGTASGTPLSAQEYKSVKSNWYPELNITFDITNILKVQHISTTDANNTTLRFKSADGNLYDIEIKKLLLKKKTDASSDNLAQNIKIKTLQVNKKNSLLLQATTSISIENLDIDKNSTVTIKAPTVIINNLEALKKCTIKIVANKIDITNITLKNRADLTIESYDEDTHIDMRIDKLKLNKAFTLLNSGEYHIKRVELKNRSELSVGESVQIVNRRVVVLNHSLINASKDIPICDDTHNSNALFIYSDDLLRVENHSKIVGFVYINRRIELTNHSGIKGAISSKNRAILTNHSKVCYTSCNITPLSVDTTPPIITLNGENNITIIQGNEYSELGATAVDDVDGNVSVVISGDINSSTLGVYTIIYTAVDSMNNSANKIRTVNVIKAPDTTPPVITLNGDANITITKYNEYIELNATAIDDRDGNVFVSISGDVNSSREGVYTITYSATDSSGNSATKTRTVNVIEAPDTTPPVISLNGDAEITIIKGGVYNELGATAVDDIDENISVTISGSVDIATVETYIITYSATDSAGNEAILTREVNVVEPIVEYGVKVGKVEGQTATYYDVARFTLSLKSKPEANVTIPLSSSDETEGKIRPIDGDSTKVVFTPDNWNIPQMVYIKGQKKNTSNKTQNYKIILGIMVSDDANYDGIDPDDVEMKGLILSVEKPTDINFIAKLEKHILIKTHYNGKRVLTYRLSEHPEGMTIDPRIGRVTWTPPESAKGNSYPVEVSVENREFYSTVTFNVVVADVTLIETEINGTNVTVIEEGNLKGLTITTLDNNIDPADIKLSKTLQSNLLEIPDFVTRISDFFVFNESVSGRVRLKLPLSQLPSGVNLNYVSLYSLGTAEDINEEFWGPTGVDEKIVYEQGVPFLQLELYDLEGASFIGFEVPEFSKNNVPFIPFEKKSSSKFSKINILDINCTPIDNNGTLNYMIQNCQVHNSNILVKNFGTSANSIKWGGSNNSGINNLAI